MRPPGARNPGRKFESTRDDHVTPAGPACCFRSAVAAATPVPEPLLRRVATRYFANQAKGGTGSASSSGRPCRALGLPVDVAAFRDDSQAPPPTSMSRAGRPPKEAGPASGPVGMQPSSPAQYVPRRTSIRCPPGPRGVVHLPAGGEAELSLVDVPAGGKHGAVHVPGHVMGTAA